MSKPIVAVPPMPEPFVGTDSPQPRYDDAVSKQDAIAASSPRSLKSGCWLISYKPLPNAGNIIFDGTLRIENKGTTQIASGDLYFRAPLTNVQPVVIPPGPDPSKGIPIQPRHLYNSYIRVTAITPQTGDTFVLTFEAYTFDLANQLWQPAAPSSANMTWKQAPTGYPSPSDYAEGDVSILSSGKLSGHLTIGWLSSFHRKAVVEMDTVKDSVYPEESGTGHTWTTVFTNLGWDVTVSPNERDVVGGDPDTFWSDAQMHAAMLAHREKVDLDLAWHYHILCVKRIASTQRGIMYDADATDSNSIPREGVGIATDWPIPKDPEWGSEQGKLFGTSKPLFFRTAVHELGHAMGLYHDTADNGFMNTTDVISARSTPSNPFPGNIKWDYASQGLRALRHYPDLYVRPGGLEFGGASFGGMGGPIVAGSARDAGLGAAMEIDVNMKGVEVKVTPLETEVPLGAPVRVEVELVNNGADAVIVPADISLKSDFVKGSVKKIDGNDRGFRSLVKCVDDSPKLKELKEHENVSANLTLLRGKDGALFHSSGLFEISVTIRWPLGGGIFASCSGSSTVYVLPPENVEQAKIAHKMLTTPDAHLVLVMGTAGGEHLRDGVNAIKEASGSKSLGGHYAAVEAKRLLQLGAHDPGRAERGLSMLLDHDLICTSAEKKKLQRLVGGVKDKVEEGKLAQALQKLKGDAH